MARQVWLNVVVGLALLGVGYGLGRATAERYSVTPGTPFPLRLDRLTGETRAVLPTGELLDPNEKTPAAGNVPSYRVPEPPPLTPGK